MGKDDNNRKTLIEGHQPKSKKFGHQPKESSEGRGYQPKLVEAKPEGKAPPSGGSNVKTPKKA